MDVDKMIQELNDEIERIKAAVACLEKLRSSSGASPTEERRGRKSMGAEERLAVSERMRKYWAGRKRKQPRTKSA
jgi:hypothetical protein